MRLLILFLLSTMLLPVFAGERVVLQLKWKHQFQFAGYYAAIEKGYFAQAGFDVQLRELEAGEDPSALVLSGQADYGVATSELALQRGLGKPVVALAVILQHSPLVLLVDRRRVASPSALVGRRIMLAEHEMELTAYLRRRGIVDYAVVPHSFETEDLVAGRVEAVSAYITDEPYLLRQADFPFVPLSPTTAGIDFYGDVLFTSEKRIAASRARVAAFREAALKGWSYAVEHPEEIVDLILEKYTRRHSREHLLYEAREIKRLMQPELVEIGTQSASRWQRIVDTFAELGMLEPGTRLEGLIFDPEGNRWPAWLPLGATAAVMLLLTVGVLALYFARLNRRLSQQIVTRRAFEHALQTSEERYRQLAEYSQDVIWTMDLPSLRFTYISPSIKRVCGFTPDEALDRPLDISLSPASYCAAVALLEAHRKRFAEGDLTALSLTMEVDVVHKDGHLIRSEVVASFLLDARGEPNALLGIARDISERYRAEQALRSQLDENRKLQQALREQAIRDSLTGCFNRRYLDETLEREVARARRERCPLALLMIDLDHFKRINDTHGHQAGDHALIALAQTLQAGIRHEDVLCRYGGEEFVILMPGMPLVTARERAEAWGRKIAQITVGFAEFTLRFTASIGVAAYPEHGQTPDQLTHAADAALYTAKAGGRNRVVVHRSEEKA